MLGQLHSLDLIAWPYSRKNKKKKSCNRQLNFCSNLALMNISMLTITWSWYMKKSFSHFSSIPKIKINKFKHWRNKLRHLKKKYKRLKKKWKNKAQSSEISFLISNKLKFWSLKSNPNHFSNENKDKNYWVSVYKFIDAL